RSHQHRGDLLGGAGHVAPVEEVVTEVGPDGVGQLVADLDGHLGNDAEAVALEAVAVARGEQSTGTRYTIAAELHPLRGVAKGHLAGHAERPASPAPLGFRSELAAIEAVAAVERIEGGPEQ